MVVDNGSREGVLAEPLPAAVRSLRVEVDVAGMRLEVALAILTVISDQVEDHDDQVLVIEDVVRRWRGLSPAARLGFGREGSPFGALTWFAWAYVEEMNTAAFAGIRDEDLPGPEEAEAMLRRHWRRLLAGLRRPEPQRVR